ncbi:hypothetical protein HYH03_003419 [Edaphochlamys debaryana]|uniref:JmjC domain-containing protein n=1 Tax=Edaphochlamys debaryana TaxID=47281 RepID=A0A835YBI1_9CHLO|nr:hypothetical protein HYH03_003419 [Edaphochlamys debaryana]|eukprot:KAG2498674.1 hypothetical protein HYH03_003419 [Edaphochlamys debaryana]
MPPPMSPDPDNPRNPNNRGAGHSSPQIPSPPCPDAADPDSAKAAHSRGPGSDAGASGGTPPPEPASCVVKVLISACGGLTPNNSAAITSNFGHSAPAGVTVGDDAARGCSVALPLEVGYLLAWRQDAAVAALFDDLAANSGGAAVESIGQLLAATQRLLEAHVGLEHPSSGAPDPTGQPTASEPSPSWATDHHRPSPSAPGAAAAVGGPGSADGPPSTHVPGLASGGALASASVLATAGALLELCWSKLHLGYWKDVAVAWRNAYSLACLLDAHLRLLLPPADQPSSQPPPHTAHDAIPRVPRASLATLGDVLRQVDLGLMMGGPLWRPHAHAFVTAAQAALAEASEAAAADQAEAAADQDVVRADQEAVAADQEAGAGEAEGLSVGEEADSAGGEEAEHEGRSAKRQRTHGVEGPKGAPCEDGGVLGGAAAGRGGPGPGHVRLPPGSLGGPPGARVPYADAPDLEEFLLSYLLPQQPVVITGAMEHWPALRRWGDLGYLQRVAGARTVPVEVGAHYLAEGWGQRLMTFGDFLALHIRGGGGGAGRGAGATAGAREVTATEEESRASGLAEGNATDASGSALEAAPGAALGYLAQHPLFEQIPVLRADILEPDYCGLGEGEEGGEVQAVNAWFGPAGTTTPLHTDPHHNLLAQVVGRKYVRLYHPRLTPRLHPFPADTVTSNSSQVDLDLITPEEPPGEVQDVPADGGTEVPGSAPRGRAVSGSSLSYFPGVGALPYEDVVLEPGQMLFIPRGWWHFVRSLSVSFSAAF